MHRSGAKIMLYNVSTKGSPLLLHIFIWMFHSCFAVTRCPSATSIYLSVSYNDPGIKSETYGVIWHIDPESKIQLVNWELTPKSLLELLWSPDVHSIDAYIYGLIIITVVALFLQCSITLFIETDLLFLFLIISRWFWKFSN